MPGPIRFAEGDVHLPKVPWSCFHVAVTVGGESRRSLSNTLSTSLSSWGMILRSRVKYISLESTRNGPHVCTSMKWHH